MAGNLTEVANIALAKNLPCEMKDHNDEHASEMENLKMEIEHFDPVQRIKEGFTHFKIHKFDKYRDYFHQLAEKQTPKFMIFACSDSRVCPSIVLNFQPGEAFMFRNIANLVPPFDKLRYSGVGAAIEYGVEALGVTNILVIGHSRCGGINRLMTLSENEEPANDFIDDWVKIGLPAKSKVLYKYGDLPFDLQCRKCEVEAVNLSLMNLLSYPYVRAKVEKGTLELRGGHYNFVEGGFRLWDFHCGTTNSVLI